MGEDSIFNGMLPVIRDGVVNAIGGGQLDVLKQTVESFANQVAAGMKYVNIVYTMLCLLHIYCHLPMSVLKLLNIHYITLYVFLL